MSKGLVYGHTLPTPVELMVDMKAIGRGVYRVSAPTERPLKRPTIPDIMSCESARRIVPGLTLYRAEFSSL